MTVDLIFPPCSSCVSGRLERFAYRGAKCVGCGARFEFFVPASKKRHVAVEIGPELPATETPGTTRVV